MFSIAQTASTSLHTRKVAFARPQSPATDHAHDPRLHATITASTIPTAHLVQHRTPAPVASGWWSWPSIASGLGKPAPCRRPTALSTSAHLFLHVHQPAEQRVWIPLMPHSEWQAARSADGAAACGRNRFTTGLRYRAPSTTTPQWHRSHWRSCFRLTCAWPRVFWGTVKSHRSTPL